METMEKVERRQYEMSAEDLEALMSACKPTPAMYLSGGQQMGPSPRENANRAWVRLGEKMGFDGTTAKPIPGRNAEFFTAVPSQPKPPTETAG